MKKNHQNHSLGSAKSSIPSQIFKNNKSSSKKDDKISKYFSTKIINEDTKSQNTEQLDKNPLGVIKHVSINDDIDKDFMTPKPIKVKKKLQEKKIVKLKSKVTSTKKNLKTKTTTKKNPFFKVTEDNFGVTDVNPDHLQVAIALSKSTYAAEYPELSKEVDDDFPTFLSPEKIPKRRTTLEKYGFKTNKNQLVPQFKRTLTEAPKKKNSKFRFITPTLKTRTVEERESIISSKISLILHHAKTFLGECSAETQVVDDCCSEILETYKGSYSLFAISGSNPKGDEQYYSKNLNISPTKSKCGCLLKKWENIIGREKSPERIVEKPIISLESHKNVEEEARNQQEEVPNKGLCVEYETNRDCITPDLFESESESECIPVSPNMENDFSQSLLSPSKNQHGLITSQSSVNSDKQPLKYKADINIEIMESDTSCNSESNLNDLTRRSSASAKRNFKKTKEFEVVSSSDDDTEKLYKSSLTSEELTPKRNKETTKESSPIISSGAGSFTNFKNRHEDFIVDLTFSSSSNDSTSHHSEKNCRDFELNDSFGIIENSYIDKAHVEDLETNFEMSPLHLKDSDDIAGNYRLEIYASETSPTISQNIKESRLSKVSPEVSPKSIDLDKCSAILNVTDYINQILNENGSKIDSAKADHISLENNSFCKTSSENYKQDTDSNSNTYKEPSLSQESNSQESIVISDEELNYSSIHSKDTKYNRNFYNLSDASEPEINENSEPSIDVDEIYNIHSELRNKYKIKNLPSPVHSRISELKGNATPKKTTLSKEILEDSFNEVLENSDIFRVLENKVIQKPSLIKDDVNKITPDKCSKISPTIETTTPENNLIIKTKDITPLADYDAMDTPNIKKELQKFGMKPLKRQRGVKLLKYLYECTHPLLGPDSEELSSDEDDQQRVTKRRKRNNDAVKVVDNANCVHENIEILGDAILKNENLDELIFERKFSVRIPSCRIPLQIVWHNFLSKNAHIKENILLYEPLQLEVLHAMLKEQTGCKFHIQDLLKFFDRKCITVRVAQGSQKGKRKI